MIDGNKGNHQSHQSHSHSRNQPPYSSSATSEGYNREVILLLREISGTLQDVLSILMIVKINLEKLPKPRKSKLQQQCMSEKEGEEKEGF